MYFNISNFDSSVFFVVLFVKATPDEFERIISDAIDAGYRHIDGAMFYGNEADLGVGIRKKIEAKVVKREDLFLVSKVSTRSVLGSTRKYKAV